jgi:hypothetical protein
MASGQVCHSPGIIPIDCRLFIDNNLVLGLSDARVETLGGIETNVIVDTKIWLSNFDQDGTTSGRIIHNACEIQGSFEFPRLLTWSKGYGLVIEPTKLKELGSTVKLRKTKPVRCKKSSIREGK